MVLAIPTPLRFMETQEDRIQITLYTRPDCSLCEEMKVLLQGVMRGYPLELSEVNIDQDPGLRERFGHEVPVLFIEGRKAFKYRVTEQELRQRLDRTFRMRHGKDHPRAQ